MLKVKSRFFIDFFCLTVPKKIVGNLLACHWFRVSKNFMLKGVLSRSFVDGFVSQYQNILQGNPSVLCFRKVPIANKFMDKNGGASR